MEIALIFLSALVGSLLGAFLGSLTGRDTALDGRMVPLRTALIDLADRFEHFSKRERKRDRDAGRQVAPPTTAMTVQGRVERLRAVRERVATRAESDGA